MCEEAGVVFQPMIFESTGEVSVEAERVPKSVIKAIAVNTGSPKGEVATLLWQRLSVAIQEAGHRAFIRRVGGVPGGMDSAHVRSRVSRDKTRRHWWMRCAGEVFRLI